MLIDSDSLEPPSVLHSKFKFKWKPIFSTFSNFSKKKNIYIYILDAATSSGILKANQKLGVTFNSDKLGSIDFTKFSKLSMCSAGAGRCWLVQWPGLPPRHCTWSVL